MKKEFLAIIAGTILIMAFMYWKDSQGRVDQIQPSVQSNTDLNNSDNIPQENFVAGMSSSDSTTEMNSHTFKNLTLAGSDREVSTQFVQTLKTIGQCLQIKNVVDFDQIDPTFDNLIVSLKPAIGDVTVYTDDWSQTDVKFNDGAMKRIRTEINYDNPGNPVKFLQLYKLNEMGVPELEDLDPQQATNPLDEYIESLRAGANTMLHEKGGRAYFQGGEEIVIIERNAKIESITMTKNNKTVSCNSMSSKESSCQCF